MINNNTLTLNYIPKRRFEAINDVVLRLNLRELGDDFFIPENEEEFEVLAEEISKRLRKKIKR